MAYCRVGLTDSTSKNVRRNIQNSDLMATMFQSVVPATDRRPALASVLVSASELALALASVSEWVLELDYLAPRRDQGRRIDGRW